MRDGGLQSVERVSGVLLAFSLAEPVLGVSEIARRLGIPKSAVHRTLTSLTRSGLVARDAGGARYRLGPRAVEIGMAAMGTADVRTVALPVMQELSRGSGETATLSLLSGDERVYAAQVESVQDVRMTVELGRRFPLYAGASGQAILAALPAATRERYLAGIQLAPLTGATITDRAHLVAALATARRQGYAASRGQRDAWAAAVAAPITVAGRRVVGCLSICGPLGRFDDAAVRRHGEAVREGALLVSGELA